MPIASLREDLRRILLAATMPLVVVASAAVAQTCSADVQCYNGGRSHAICIGDTLIVKRSICAGTCREVEERRQNCGSRVLAAIRCEGATAIRTEGGCNAALSTCDNRIDREICVKACSCNENRLYIATGTCTPGAGCARTVVQCSKGCACSPEPKCL